MKQSIYIFRKKIVLFMTLLAAFFTTSCEDVIDVPLTTAPPRLVVDASITWEKGTAGTTQKIILTTSTDYYGTVIPAASGATVKVINRDNTNFNFTEDGITGTYICTNFKSTIGETYTLSILYKGEVYTATETMQSVPKIDGITQTSNGGILKDQYEVFFFYRDVANVANYNLARFLPNYLKVPTFYAGDDRFNDGKESNWNYSEKDLKPGNTLECTHYGISKTYFNYMSILISVAGGDGGGGPFQTAPVSVRGNVVNQTKIGNYALGYFNVSETENIVYTIK